MTGGDTVPGQCRGYIYANSAVNRQANFTGQHRCFVKNKSWEQINNLIGLIVVTDSNDYINMSDGTIRGKEAITIDESLPTVSLSTKENDKKCFGVICTTEDIENRKDQYGAFVTPYPKEKGDTRAYINSLGEGAIWVTNANGSLEAGDYITTSFIPGYGMRQSDDLLHNYTVAKITMDCDFTNPFKPKYIIEKDSSGNNILDALGNISWVQEKDENNAPVFESSYNIRYLNKKGDIITKDEYDNLIDDKYIAAFVGCTYHCG